MLQPSVEAGEARAHPGRYRTSGALPRITDLPKALAYDSKDCGKAKQNHRKHKWCKQQQKHMRVGP